MKNPVSSFIGKWSILIELAFEFRLGVLFDAFAIVTGLPISGCCVVRGSFPTVTPAHVIRQHIA